MQNLLPTRGRDTEHRQVGRRKAASKPTSGENSSELMTEIKITNSILPFQYSIVAHINVRFPSHSLNQ